MKEIAAIVAGTGFEGRNHIIRARCKVNAKIDLQRESNNSHDPNAIAVYLHSTSMFGLLKRREHIGYIKADRAAKLAPKIDSGALQVTGCYVTSFYAPESENIPRVSITIQTNQ